ncbi:MAG: hypothetical protein K9M15_00525 [Candidatus Marinimicrobia bacterium]|nr:hypothetical protein [Candidatus Neomarinimicrobiota bacterium]
MMLKIIYVVFIGALFAVFVGVGISAFYPAPEYPDTPRALKIYDVPINPSCDTSINAQLEEEQNKFDEEVKAYREESESYNRNVSIISLIVSILAMAISLVVLRNIPVIADGLLLGGVLTLLYSVVRIFGSDNDKLRFVVVAIGFMIALVLGYLKFVKPSKK